MTRPQYQNRPRKTLYARRDKKFGPRLFVGLKLHPRTIAGITYLKEQFASRYPAEKCPSLSMIMSNLIDAKALLFDCRPSLLNAEIKDFRDRYATKAGSDGR